MNDVRIIFLPADVWQGVLAKGIAPEDVAKCSDAFMQQFTDQDLAAVHALQTLQPVVNALGSAGFFTPNYQTQHWNRFTDVVRPLSESSYIKDRVMAGVAGPFQESRPPISVVDMGPGNIGLVMGPGTLDALRKDNSVLQVLTSVMQKALVYGQLDVLMASQISGFVTRFVTVNTFANVNRPPSPVFR